MCPVRSIFYPRANHIPSRTWFCMYVPVRPLTTKPSHAFDRFVFTSQGTTASSSAVAAAVPPILLRFPKKQRIGLDADGVEDNPGEGAASLMRLVVGSLAMTDPKKSSPGSFEVRAFPEELATDDAPEQAR